MDAAITRLILFLKFADMSVPVVWKGSKSTLNITKIAGEKIKEIATHPKEAAMNSAKALGELLMPNYRGSGLVNRLGTLLNYATVTSFLYLLTQYL